MGVKDAWTHQSVGVPGADGKYQLDTPDPLSCPFGGKGLPTKSERFWNWKADVVSPALTEVWQPPGKRKACQSRPATPTSWPLASRVASERFPTAGNSAGRKVERDAETLTPAIHQEQRPQCNRLERNRATEQTGGLNIASGRGSTHCAFHYQATAIAPTLQ